MKEFAIALLLISGVIKVQLQIMAPGTPDLTLIAILLLFLTTLFSLNAIFTLKRNFTELVGASLFLAFSAMIVFSSVYADNEMVFVKLSKFGLVFFVFLITLLNSNLDIKKTGLYYILFSFISAVLFLIIYPKFKLGLLGAEADILKRSYLAFADSCVISMILLVTINKDLRFKTLLILFFLLSLMLSGARAPLLFFVLLASIAFAVKGSLFLIQNKGYSSLKFVSYTLLVVILSTSAIVNLDVSKIQQSSVMKTLELSASRFQLLFSENKGASINVRTKHIDSSLDEISQQLVGGVGLGGYSKYAFGIDKYDYPHNLFFEVWVENGIFAVLFLLGFLCLVFYSVSIQNYNPAILLIISYCFLNAQKSLSYADNRVMIFWCAVALISSRLKLTECRS